jgi:serine/threonine protein kinase
MAKNPTQPPDELPASFGRYRLVKLLGKGGMGSVYLAHDSQLDRSVALKIPLLEEGDRAQVLARFLAEARAAAALNHPNICRIHDVGEVDSIPYLTMAYIEGKPLGEYVQLRPPIHRQSAILVRKLALALHEAHQRGVVHRDLKPANIMIDKRGEPSIMDFGLARRAGKGDARLTQAGEIMGTPAYMSPEQIQGQLDAIGPTTDVYSLGVILYELLAGRLPFTGDVMAMLSRVLLDEPPPPSKFVSDLAPELEAICLKAMAKQGKDRYQSMADFASALFDHVQGKSAITPSSPAPRRSGQVSRISGTTASDLPGASSSATRKPAGLSTRRRKREARRDGFPVWPAVVGGAILLVLVLVVTIWLVSRVRKLTSGESAAVSPSAREEDKSNPPDGASARQSGAGFTPPERGKFPGSPGEGDLGNDPPVDDRPAFEPSPPFRSRMGLEFVLVPKGKGWVGGGRNRPGLREVEIAKDFYLGKYEVTQEEWLKVMGSTFSAFSNESGVSPEDQKRFPFAGASKDDARAFIRKLNELEDDPGWLYRLPKEDEWEYACRGGPMTDRRQSAFDYYLKEASNNLKAELVNFGGSVRRPSKVGSYPPNRLGLHDMHGNVWEWCDDTLFDDNGKELEVRRGGCFIYHAGTCTASHRYVLPKLTARYGDNGLRVARVPAGEKP